MRKSGKKKSFKFLFRMKKKLFYLFFIILGILIVLIGRLAYIELKSGERYEKIVLSQQEYSTTTIPFCRGDIVDRKGTVLATSTDVYNVILDCSVLTSKDEYLDPTIDALVECFDLDEDELRDYVEDNPSSRYYVLAKKLSYDEVQKFKDMQAVATEENDGSDEAKAEAKKAACIKGVWFEKEYVRNYPYSTLASAVIGFTTSGNEGIGGIEDYYNDTLNGTDGREYGYLNSDSNYEVNVKEPINGETVVSTIDINLQSIVEEKIAEFDDAIGAEHIGVVMMDPNTGEVLAMANYPNYDLTDPWDLTRFYSDEEIESMNDDTQLDALNELWQNFCITYTYEPGSTVKPFTVAAGLDSGKLTGNETYYCDGYEKIADYTIKCISTSGHGVETVKQALENSCNDALMQMSYVIGPEVFAKYQQIFNFGLKTNIDLPGEARTDSLIFPEDELSTINLATNAFGQNFNVTMIQVISAYNSIVNGGSYYKPHIVCRLEDEKGNTVETIEPELLRNTVSEETAETLKDYLKGVIEEGSGTKAKVDGYSMCGKTGTAQKLPRTDRKYLVSFIGSVPADNPQVSIYVVVDEAYSEDQAHSYYAQSIAREILEEALPYLGIYPDEETTGINEELGITGLVSEAQAELTKNAASIRQRYQKERAEELAAASDSDSTDSESTDSDSVDSDNTDSDNTDSTDTDDSDEDESDTADDAESEETD